MSRRSKLWRAILGAGAGLGAMVAVHAAAVDKYLDDAKRYQEKGEHRAAIIQFKNALQQDANNRDARMLLAQSYLQIGDGASAEKELKRAQELGASPDQVVPLLAKSYLLQAKVRQLLADFQPDKLTSPQARATLLAAQGTAHLALKEFAQAQDKFDAALKLDGGSSDALLGRLRAAIYQQHIAEAQQQADELVKRFPRLAEAWLLKGEIHRMRSEPQLALDAYQQVISIEPDNINGYIGHAMMLISQQKHAEAGRDLDVLSQKVPQHPMIHYLKGLSAFQQGKMDAAKESLQKVVLIAPNYAPSYLLLGAIQYNENQLESAAESLKRFISAVPEHLPARKLFAATMLKLKQPARAIETLDVAAKQAPNDAQLLALLGSAYMQKGDSSKGIEYLERAAKAAPDAASIRTQLALGYLATGESGQAVSQLESAVDLGQGLVQADMLLVFTHLQRREYDDAIKAAQAMAKKMPKSPVPVNMIGVADMGKQDAVAARKAFESALKLDSAFSAAHINLAKLDEVAGKPDAAKKHYEAVIAHDDQHVGAMMSLARLAEQAGKPDEALKWLERAREKAPDSVEAGLVLAQYHLRHGDAAKALIVARDVANRSPDHPAVLETLGQAQLANGQASNAMASFRRLVDNNPKEVQAYYLLALAQAKAEDNKAAIATLGKALDVQPDHVPSLVALAGLKLAGGQTKEATDLARRLQKRDADAAVGYELEGRILFKEGKFEEAATLFDKSYKKSPSAEVAVNYYQARRNLGRPDAAELMTRWLKDHPDDTAMAMRVAMVYQSEKRNKEAITYYERVVKKQPENAVALNNLAWIYHEEGDKRAVDLAERAYRLKPEDSSIADTFGWILVQRGDAGRGVTVLQEAAMRAPQVGEIRYHLAVGLEKVGRHDEAGKELKRLLRDHDDFPQAKEAQALLDQLQKK